MDDAPVADGEDADEACLRAALVADLDAGFTALVATHGDLVFSLALRSTAHRADAEDLAAEAFLRAYRALRGYDADRLAALLVRPWLVTVVLNTARNRARTRERRPATSDAALPDRADPAPGVEDRVAAGDEGRALAGHLATLPERQRVAVVLRHVVDLPIAEVARAMGVPDGTARSHVSRGLAQLRALVDPSLPTPGRQH